MTGKAYFRTATRMPEHGSDTADVKDERREEWIILIAAYAGNMLFPLAYFMNGVLYVALLDYYGDSPVKTSLVVSINSALLCLLGPLSGFLINISSCRVVEISGSVVLTCGCFLSAFVHSVDWLILTYGIIAGIGNALVGVPKGVVLGFVFTENTDIVMSLSTVMIGIGMLISSPLALYIINTYGVNGTFIILSGIYLNLCVIGMLFKPSKTELEIKMERKSIDDLGDKYNRSLKTRIMRRIRLLISELLNLPFVLILVSTYAWNLMLAVCQMHLPNYMVSIGSPKSSIALIMLCFGVSNTAGRTLGALTLLKFCTLNPIKLHTFALGLSGFSTVTFPYYKGIVYSEYIVATIAGITTGISNAVMSPLAIRYVGVENLSLAYGFTFFACGLGFLSGPPAASALYSDSESYNSSFVLAGAVNLVGCFSSAVSFYLLSRKRQKRKEEVVPDISDELVPMEPKDP